MLVVLIRFRCFSELASINTSTVESIASCANRPFAVRLNDAVYKFKRYEDASLNYTGINKHEDEDIGLFDTVLSREDAAQVYKNVPLSAV